MVSARHVMMFVSSWNPFPESLHFSTERLCAPIKFPDLRRLHAALLHMHRSNCIARASSVSMPDTVG